MPAKINLDDKFARFSDQWSPKIVARFNGNEVRLCKLEGEFHWHAHSETDEMFLVAAKALAGCVDDDRLAQGALYPPQSDLRHVSRLIAIAVAREARDRGLGRTDTDEEIERAVDAAIWEPVYEETR